MGKARPKYRPIAQYRRWARKMTGGQPHLYPDGLPISAGRTWPVTAPKVKIVTIWCATHRDAHKRCGRIFASFRRLFKFMRCS